MAQQCVQVWSLQSKAYFTALHHLLLRNPEVIELELFVCPVCCQPILFDKAGLDPEHTTQMSLTT